MNHIPISLLIDHFVLLRYKKSTALFEKQPFLLTFLSHSKTQFKFFEILPRKKPSLMYNFFLLKIPFLRKNKTLRKYSKNAETLNLPCHITNLFLSTEICSTLPIQTRYSLSN